MNCKAPLNQRGQSIIVENLSNFEFLLYAIQNEMSKNNNEVPTITIDPGSVHSIASCLESLLVRHQPATLNDPLLMAGEKVRNACRVSAEEADVQGVTEVAFRPETLWVCAWTLFVLYMRELNQGLINQSFILNFSGLGDVLRQTKSVDYLSFVEKTPHLDELAMAVVVRTSPAH